MTQVRQPRGRRPRGEDREEPLHERRWRSSPSQREDNGSRPHLRSIPVGPLPKVGAHPRPPSGGRGFPDPGLRPGGSLLRRDRGSHKLRYALIVGGAPFGTSKYNRTVPALSSTLVIGIRDACLGYFYPLPHGRG